MRIRTAANHGYLFLIISMSWFLLTFNLNSKSLWTDEVADIGNSTKDIAVIVEWTNSDIHPPLYYVFSHYWMEVFGKTEHSYRMLSIVFATLSILVTYKIAILLSDRKIALLTVLILSISPLFVLRGSMIKWYSLATFFGLLSIWGFLRVCNDDKKWVWVIYIVASTCMIYTHYILISIIVCQHIYIVVFKKEYNKILPKWYLSQLAIFLLYLPQISVLIGQILSSPNYGSSAPLALGLKGIVVKIAYPLYAFCFGETILPWKFFVTLPASIIYLLLFVKGLKTYFPKREVLIFALLFFCVPIFFLIFVCSTILLSESFHTFPGNLFFLLPVFCFVIASGIYSIEKRTFQIFALGVVVLISGYSLKNYYQGREYINPNYMIPWKQISRDLKSEVSEDDFVIATDESLYYYRGSLPMLLMDETRKTTEIKKYIKKTLPRNIWLQVRDWGDFAGALWVREFRDWLSNNCVLSTGERGYVEEDKATIFFKEKLLKRPVPKYKVMIYKYTKK